MKKCDFCIKKEDGIDRYCSMKCDNGNCLTCVLDDAKSLIFKMQQCDAEKCSDDCMYITKFRKISSRVTGKINRTR